MKRNEAELLLKVSLKSEKLERQRIAADLHDSVSSDLSAIRNFLAVIMKMEKEEEQLAIFKELRVSVENAIENTRLVSYRLSPPLLDKFGFVIALDDYLNNLSKKTGCTFSVYSKDGHFHLESDIAYELYRVIQEFTTNMLKYGNINFCKVELYCLGNSAYIEIIDDGISFNFDNMLETSLGTGIKNIDSRLKMIGANIEQLNVSIGNHFVITLDL